jgi:hypothetical protein
MESDYVILGGVGQGIGLSLLGQRPAHIHTRIPFHLYAHLRSSSYHLDNTHITGIRFSTTTKSFFHTLAPIYLAGFKPIAVIKVRSESQQRPDQEYVYAIVRKLFPDGYLVD